MEREFSAAKLRRRFANAFPPQPFLYWSDLLISASIGWGAFTIGATASPGTLSYLVATGIALVALLRSAIFIHEIAHLRDQSLPGFEVAWNLLVGFPFLLPSLMYVGSHNDHHRQPTFGTSHDPEYAPISYWSRGRILWFVVSTVFVPVLLIVRWGILGPLSFFIPRLRRWLIARASTLVINPDYRRPVLQGKPAVRWVMQEIAVAVTFWSIVVSLMQGWLSLQWFVQWYIVAAGMLMINQLRTLAAHRYDNDGSQLDATAQLLDSVTLSGWTFPTVLAAPVGLRFHALHHVLPTVPYHSLGSVHRLLLAELPSDSPYRLTQERGIGSAIFALLRKSRELNVS
jgi:fatty acid desaturase